MKKTEPIIPDMPKQRKAQVVNMNISSSYKLTNGARDEQPQGAKRSGAERLVQSLSKGTATGFRSIEQIGGGDLARATSRRPAQWYLAYRFV